MIGTGKIGALVARTLAAGFGCRVLACDLQRDASLEALGVTYTDPRTLAAESDIITLHCPLTPETHHVIRTETLALKHQEGPAGTPTANAVAGEPSMPAVPVAGAVDGSYAPFVPKHTPKNGESDGL